MRIQKRQINLIVFRNNYIYIEDHRQKLYIVHVVDQGRSIDEEETI